MGTIERLADGTYEVAIPCQDGRDRSIAETEAEAIEQYRHGHAFLNPGTDPAKVRVPEIIDRQAWPRFTVSATGGYAVPNDRIIDAVRLAAHELKPGRRYELRVVAVELPGEPIYVGDGI